MDNGCIIHIVDDDEAVRGALGRMFESLGMHSRAHGSAREFLAAYDPDKPGCLILDLRMPEMSGLELQELLARDHISLPIIVISGHGDVPIAVRAMKRGAMDVLEKPFRQQELLDRVNEALAKDAHHREVVKERSSLTERLALLTRRERDVMERLVAGETAEQIGLHLGLSAKTVYTHRGRILLKLRVDSIAALTRLALSAEARHEMEVAM